MGTRMTIKNIKGEVTEVKLKPGTTKAQAEKLAETFHRNPQVDPKGTIIS